MLEVDIPRLSKAGCASDQTVRPRRSASPIGRSLNRGRGGYKRTAKRTLLIEVTNRPVCASKEWDLLIDAQPPRLGKAGNVHLNDSLCKAPRCKRREEHLTIENSGERRGLLGECRNFWGNALFFGEMHSPERGTRALVLLKLD